MSPPHTCVPNLVMRRKKRQEVQSLMFCFFSFVWPRSGGFDSPNGWAAVLVVAARSCHLEVDGTTSNRQLHRDERVLESSHLQGDIISLWRSKKY